MKNYTNHLGELVEEESNIKFNEIVKEHLAGGQIMLGVLQEFKCRAQRLLGSNLSAKKKELLIRLESILEEYIRRKEAHLSLLSHELCIQKATREMILHREFENWAASQIKYTQDNLVDLK